MTNKELVQHSLKVEPKVVEAFVNCTHADLSDEFKHLRTEHVPSMALAFQAALSK